METTRQSQLQGSGKPAVRCSDIVQTFGSVRAVDGVSLSVPSGSVTALLGPNGAGKTTLIDVLLGLVPPRSGSVELFGMTPQQAITCGYVGASQQTLRVPDIFTVTGVLRAAAAMWDSHLPLDMVVQLLHLQPLLKRKVKKLSGGERQRVHTAIALLPNPNLLFFDEPTTGMDVNARREFWDIMHELANAGRTLLFATHYLEEAQNFADNVVIMSRGRVVATGAPSEIQRLARARLYAVVPDAEREALRLRLLAAREAGGWGAAWQINFDGEGIEVLGANLDEAARIVLATPGAHDLTLVPASLDEAFAAITAPDKEN